MLWDHRGMQPVLGRDAQKWDAVVSMDGWCSAEGRLLTPQQKLDPQIHGNISAAFWSFDVFLLQVRTTLNHQTTSGYDQAGSWLPFPCFL